MPMKKEVKKGSKRVNELLLYFSPRYILGLVLISSSFASAYLISKSSDRMITVWGASVDLAPGESIQASDLEVISVRLPENASQYLDARTELIGATVLRAIGKDELIPSYALSDQPNLSFARVPISIPREWAPSELRTGMTVDLYGIPNRTNQFSEGASANSRLIIPGISIDSVDDSTRELGGRIGLTLLVPQTEVNTLISAFSKYEFLLVMQPTSR